MTGCAHPAAPAIPIPLFPVPCSLFPVVGVQFAHVAAATPGFRDPRRDLARNPLNEHQSRSILRVFGQPKMAALLFLGFSSGLPLFLTSSTLQAWMTVEKVDLTTVG